MRAISRLQLNQHLENDHATESDTGQSYHSDPGAGPIECLALLGKFATESCGTPASWGEKYEKEGAKRKRSAGKPANLIELLEESLNRVHIRPLRFMRGGRTFGFTVEKGRLAYFFAGGTCFLTAPPAAFFLDVRFRSSRRVSESAALNGYRRTDCCPVVLKVTSTRRF